MGYDAIVIGGGAIGLAVARDLAPDHSILLLERGLPGQQASWAAAGMLCPHGEAPVDGPLFRLGLAGLDMYRGFVGDLLEETGVDAEYLDDGTLVLASGDEEWADLRSRCRWQQAAGLGTSLMTPGEVRNLEPGLTLEVPGALWCPADHQIRPRRLLEALRKSCALRGVGIVAGARVDEVCSFGNRVTGVRSGSLLYEAPRVVVAAGAWSGQIQGLVPDAETRPRKGQILALGMPRSCFRHVIRRGPYYLAPRRSGELVVGATDEDSGFDRSLTVTGISRLLEAAQEMAACSGRFRILETWAGLRPEIADGLPAIGHAAVEGLYYAFGHYRNGILHTPVTARLLGNLVRGRESAALDPAFSPMRFAGNRNTAGHV